MALCHLGRLLDLSRRDGPTTEQVRRFFNRGYLLVDMGNEGINHSRFNHLFTMLFFAWFAARKPDQYVDVLGGCVLEKPQKQAASSDIVLYLGGGSPQWRSGEPRRINLDKWRVPDLVGEVGDTTIATDLGRVINHFFDRSRLIGYGVFRYPVITRWA